MHQLLIVTGKADYIKKISLPVSFLRVAEVRRVVELRSSSHGRLATGQEKDPNKPNKQTHNAPYMIFI